MHLTECRCIPPGLDFATDCTDAAGMDTTSVCFGVLSQTLLGHRGLACGRGARMIAERSIGEARLRAERAMKCPCAFLPYASARFG